MKKNPHKIGILGSAFDPLHYGHIALARAALYETDINSVWLLPCPDRWDKKTVANAAQRLKWAQLAAAEEKKLGYNVEACDFEIQNGLFRGTYLTLKALMEKYSENEFSLILGFDSFLSLPTWKDSETQTLNGLKLLAEFNLIVSPRNETAPIFPEWAAARKENIHILKPFSSSQAALNDLGDAQFLESLSSSKVRNSLKGSSTNFLKQATPQLIEKEIWQQKLYQ